MQVSHIGNVNDFGKYALLRALAREGGVKIGICWMLRDDIGRPAEGRLSYLKPSFGRKDDDLQLFSEMSSLLLGSLLPSTSTIRSLPCLQELDYFDRIFPTKAEDRKSYFTAALEALAHVDLIYLDPDVGLEIPSAPPGRKASARYLYLDELIRFYSLGKSLLVYQHYNRKGSRADFRQETNHKLEHVCSGARVRFFGSSNVAYILIVPPQLAQLIDVADDLLVRNGWIRPAQQKA